MSHDPTLAWLDADALALPTMPVKLVAACFGESTILRASRALEQARPFPREAVHA